MLSAGGTSSAGPHVSTSATPPHSRSPAASRIQQMRSFRCTQPGLRDSSITTGLVGKISAVRRNRQNTLPATQASIRLSPRTNATTTRPPLPWQASRPVPSHDRALPVNNHGGSVISAPRPEATAQFLRPYRENVWGSTQFSRTVYREPQLDEMSIEEMRLEDSAAAAPLVVVTAPVNTEQLALAAEAAAQASLTSTSASKQLSTAQVSNCTV